MTDYFKSIRMPTGELIEVDTRGCANVNLDNITDEGKNVIKQQSQEVCLNYNQLTNCILEAPNGVATYSGNTITVKQGLKVLIPNGRNADGTLNNIEYTVSEDTSINIPTSSSYTGYLVIGTNSYCDVVSISDYYEVKSLEDRPEPNNSDFYLVYVEDEAKHYLCNRTNTYEEKTCVVLKGSEIILQNGEIISFTNSQPVELLKRSDINAIPHIIKSYINGSSYYNLYSNGWVEQGGYVEYNSSSTEYYITFLKTMRDGKYNAQVTPATNGSIIAGAYNNTTTGITVHISNKVTSFWWSVSGYAQK